MFKRILSAVIAICMVLVLYVPVNALEVGYASGTFTCTFVDNDYDSNVSTTTGVRTDGTWGGQFPIITDIVTQIAPLELIDNITVTIKASNTRPCSKGAAPKVELHWDRRDGTNAQTAEFVDGTAVVSGTLPEGVSEIVLNPYAFNSSVGAITFDISVEASYRTLSGKLGYPKADRVVWELGAGGVLNITGEGDIYPFSIYNSPFDDLSFDKAVVGEGVTTLGTYLFQFTHVKSVTLPSTLTTIGTGSFDRCWDLVDVNIPYGVTRISANAFSYCNSMAKIDIPETVTYIGTEAFIYNQAAKSVVVPGKVTYIGKSAFEICEALKTATIESGVPQLSERLFASCSDLETVSLPTTISSIPDSCFRWCSSLKNVNIPSSVTSIGAFAFASCDNLTELHVPNTVTSIASTAFNFSDKLTLYVKRNSAAHIHALTYNIPFVLEGYEHGDVNNDGVIDSFDLEAVWAHITGKALLSGEAYEKANVYADDTVDIRDYNMIYAHIAGLIEIE